MSEFSELSPLPPIELPEPRPETLPDGREGIVSGDPAGAAEFNHLQGENLYGQEFTCGLVACEGVLRQFGVKADENALVELALDHGHCDPLTGCTSFSDEVAILEDFGVPAHVEHGGSLDSLADNLEDGQGVILEVNSGALWDRPEHYGYGEANHSVLATGVVRDPNTGGVIGAYVNDAGTGESGKFVDRQALLDAWVAAGGNSVVTEAGDARDEDRTLGDLLGWLGVWD